MAALMTAAATLERFRLEVLRLYLNIAILVTLVLVPMYSYMGLPQLAVAVVAYGLAAIGLRLLLRYRRLHMPTPARVFLALTLLLILYGHYVGNEILDNKPWIIIVPILTMSLLGAAEGLAWVVLAGCGLGLVYGVAPGHYDPFSVLIQLASAATASYVFYLFSVHHERNVALICRMTHVDPLTGSYNRRCFDDNFHKEFQRTRRQAASLTVLMIDIDHFKEYNDRYGHPQGDEALSQVARALMDTLRRAGDLVYRYGGEEFCVLLSGMERDRALALAEQMRQRVHDLAIPHEDAPLGRLTVSVGLCQRGDLEDTSPEAMLAAADRALYTAKSQGRDRVVEAHCQGAATAS